MPPVRDKKRITVSDHLIRLTELGRHLRIPVSKTVVHEWATEGMKHAYDPNHRVKLEVFMYGGIRHSTVEAVDRMMEEANTPTGE